jgi:hypothetical protein
MERLKFQRLFAGVVAVLRFWKLIFSKQDRDSFGILKAGSRLIETLLEAGSRLFWNSLFGFFVQMSGEDTLEPCANFSMVSAGVYRSAFPKKRNFPFLKKLKLKSILTLILEEYPEQSRRFMEDNSIELFQFGVPGNKEPFVDIPEDIISSALSVILDVRNHPSLYV